MKFSTVSVQLNQIDMDKANQALIKIFTQLGLKENNNFNCKFGGNNFQLFSLLEMKHELTSSPKPIDINQNNVVWDIGFLLGYSTDGQRKILDQAFAKINDKYKTTSMFIQGLIKNNNLISNYQEHKSNFPLVEKCFINKKIDPALSMVEQFLLACLVCNSVSEVLDSSPTNINDGWMENSSTHQLMVEAANFLMEFNPAIHLVSVRRFITFDRLMGYNFCHSPEWINNLQRINKILKD